MKSKIPLFLFAAAVLGVALWLNCSPNPMHAEGDKGSATDVGNAMVGKLEYENGNPASGASVYLRPADYLPSQATGSAKRQISQATLDSTTTDVDGFYSFDTAEVDTYAIEARDSQSLACFIDSVPYLDPDSTVDLPTQTLKPTGSVVGTVSGLSSDMMDSVVIQVPGLDVVVTPDSSGQFSITDMPEGDFAVHITAPLPDTTLWVQTISVAVTSNQVDTLSQPVVVPGDSLKTPTSLSASVDTANGTVRLVWNRVVHTGLQGYRIFRAHSDSSSWTVLNSQSTVSDTTWIDTVFSDIHDTRTISYRYYVVAADTSGGTSPGSDTVTATAVGPHWVRTQIALMPYRDSVLVYDTVTVTGHFTNPTRKVRLLEWSVDHMDSVRRVRPLDALFGSDTLRFVRPTPGVCRVWLQVTDEGTGVWTDSVPVFVSSVLPVAYAGNDTTVSILDTFRVHPSGFSAITSMVMHRIDVNQDGIWDDSTVTSKPLYFVAGAAPETMSVTVQVEDAVGQTADDTMRVHILQDPPTLTVAGDTTVSIGDPVWLSVSASDLFGWVSIARFDLDGDHVFEHSDTQIGLHILTAPSLAGVYPGVVEVEDDDGNTTRDTITLTVLQDIPSAQLLGDTTVSINDSFTVTVVASDGFGSIAKIRLDENNDGQFDDSSTTTGVKGLKAPSSPGSYWVILEVEDDDANRARDSIALTVVQDIPAIQVAGDTTVSLDDSFMVTVMATDAFGTIVAVRFDVDNDGFFDDSSTVTGSKILRSPSTTGTYHVIVEVEDDDGNQARDSIVLDVVQDMPQIQVLGDTTVSVNDTFNVNATGTDGYGAIVLYRFDVDGNGTWDDSSSNYGIRSFVAGSTPGNIGVIVQVQDDDANTVNDTMLLTVVLGSPTANAGNDTVVDYGTAVLLAGTDSDSFGTIVQREWDFDGGATTHSYVLSDGDTSFAATTDVWPTYRVTDDDNNTAVDSFRVRVNPRAVTIVSFQTDSASAADFTWTQSEDSDFQSYRIYQSTSAGVDTLDSLIANITVKQDTTFRATGLPADTHYFRIFIFDTTGLYKPSVERDTIISFLDLVPRHIQYADAAKSMKYPQTANGIAAFLHERRWFAKAMDRQRFVG